MSQSDSPVEFRHTGDAVSGQLVGLAKESVLRQNDERHFESADYAGRL